MIADLVAMITRLERRVEELETRTEIPNSITRADGTLALVSLVDGSAANNSLYYSTTQSKAVYKDSGGTVNDLY